MNNFYIKLLSNIGHYGYVIIEGPKIPNIISIESNVSFHSKE